MATFTDPTIVAGVTNVRKVHIDDMRSEYKRIESSVTFVPGINVSFTDSTLTAGSSPIRKVHIDDLRAAINNLETKFSNNCNCLNPANCCQTTPAQCGLSQCSLSCQAPPNCDSSGGDCGG